MKNNYEHTRFEVLKGMNTSDVGVMVGNVV